MPDLPSSLKPIDEGGTILNVPFVSNPRGPAKKENGVFFNPAMEMNRDLAVLIFAATLPHEDTKILDALCASGIRGLRYAREIPLLLSHLSSSDTSLLTPTSLPTPSPDPSLPSPTSLHVQLNDTNPLAVKLAEQNAAALGMEAQVSISHERAQYAMSKEHFDIIDLDPYGPAVPFLGSALGSIAHKGILGFTATDTAVACGSYAKACQRRYQARGLRNHLCHEAGIRIIMGHAVRRAAEHDIALFPLIGYYADHYFRVTWRVEKTRSKVGKQLGQLSVGLYDPATTTVETLPWTPATPLEYHAKGKLLFGPYWDGPLLDPHTLSRLTALSQHPHALEMGAIDNVHKLVDLWNGEAGMPSFFYDTSEISRATKKEAEPRTKLIERLQEQGYKAARTHFTPTGIKTDAGWEVVSGQ
ncbi:MAG: hypothetical protein KAT70_07190 [Thermoplasmata archaeon]|nr:hypothetical protein [Thermoplasmata archaeon]